MFNYYATLLYILWFVWTLLYDERANFWILRAVNFGVGGKKNFSGSSSYIFEHRLIRATGVNLGRSNFRAVNNEQGDWLCAFPRDEQSLAIFGMMQIISTERAFGGPCIAHSFHSGHCYVCRSRPLNVLNAPLLSDCHLFACIILFCMRVRPVCVSSRHRSICSSLTHSCSRVSNPVYILVQYIIKFAKCTAIRSLITKTRFYNYYFN